MQTSGMYSSASTSLPHPSLVAHSSASLSTNDKKPRSLHFCIRLMAVRSIDSPNDSSLMNNLLKIHRPSVHPATIHQLLPRFSAGAKSTLGICVPELPLSAGTFHANANFPGRARAVENEISRD